nr:biotin-dependent carboxyltransferase family protein [Pedococcus badiiscoriae]
MAAGPLTLVEDLGRPGLASLGVGPSGAADIGAFALGARLLGQTTDLAALECHHGGLTLRARGSVTMVLTGARGPATVDGTPVGYAAPFLVRDGSVLVVGSPAAGVRTYVSVRGGIAVPTVLGSRSYDTLSGLGPAPLRLGDMLSVGAPEGELLVDVAPVVPPAAGAATLDVAPGPRHEWLGDLLALTEPAWRVDGASDRVGVRLDGPALTRAPGFDGRELPSEGIVRGAVQLPADGRPVLFLADHPVTGGYPVVGVLTPASCDRAAQLVPGQLVRLRQASSPPGR